MESDRVADQSTSNEEEQGAWARPVSARLGDVFAGLAFLASGAFFAGFATLLPFGRVGLPGPGFLPFVLGIALGVLALSILFYIWREPSDVPAVFAAAFLLLFVARAALWRVALGAVLGMVAVWLFFGVALGVRLPTGEFWQEMQDFVSAALPFRQP